ncbi:Flagellar assembly protein T N-terminal domain-containing protein [Desulfarculales bacterium]
MKNTLAALPLTMLMLCLPGLGQAAETPPSASLLVLGRAGAEANEAQAREAATNDALRRAVGQAVLEMADAGLLRSRLEILERKVLAKPSRFVTTYSLQGSFRDPEGMLALMAINVDRPALDKALVAAGLRQAAPVIGLPLVLALVSEEAAPGRPPTFWWGEVPGQTSLPQPLLRILSQSGFKLVASTALAGKVPPDSRQAVLTEEQALEMARGSGAGLLILGRLRTYPLVSREGQDTPPLAQLEALEVSSGQVLATEEAEGPSFKATPGPDGAEKVNLAAEEAVRRLLKQASAGIKPNGPPPEETVTLELGGLRSLAELNRFEQMLRGLGGLVAQVQRETVGGGKASLRVKLKGPVAKLADELMMQNYGDFLVNVLESSPQKIKLAVVGK